MRNIAQPLLTVSRRFSVCVGFPSLRLALLSMNPCLDDIDPHPTILTVNALVADLVKKINLEGDDYELHLYDTLGVVRILVDQ